MFVERLTVENYRNLSAESIQPEKEINVISGENAQGKTNLLESIWLFTGGKSFRGSKDSELVSFGQEKAKLQLSFFSEERSQEAKIIIDSRRRASLNGIKQSTVSRLTGHFCCVVFSPVHLSLIKNGPEERRKFMDAAYCQLRPGYLPILSEYQRILIQRNTLLKNARTQPLDEALLDVLDEKLAESGQKIMQARSAYLKKLLPVLKTVYAGLSSGREQISLVYRQTLSYQSFYEQLKNRHRVDIAAGFTTAGPHRDDMEVTINQTSARAFASQGQQRSAVLALKLAEATLLKEVTGQQPVALLDDVMSELDIHRQDYILNHIHDWQVFITCCDPGQILRMTGGKEFHLQNGRITE